MLDSIMNITCYVILTGHVYGIDWFATVAAFLYKMILRHGCPEEIVSDHRREFCNQLIDLLEQLTGFKHKITSAYHPQSDEHLNQMLKLKLQQLVNEHMDNWDELIDNILFAYRSSRQDSTKYGREARLPIQLTQATSELDEDDFEAKVKSKRSSKYCKSPGASKETL